MPKSVSPPSPTQEDAIKRRRGPVRRSKKGGWTKEEDEILRAAVKEFNGRSWKKIAERLPNRTNVQCLHRWQKVLNPELVKGPWTEEEDQKIIELVKKHGCENWSLIANNLDGRIGKQCRERYFNQLDPSIKKTPWTEEEKRILMESQAKMGNKWAEISKILVGRPNNQCKNMYHSIIAKRRKAKKDDEDGTSSSARPRSRSTRKKVAKEESDEDEEDDFEDSSTMDSEHTIGSTAVNSTTTPTGNLSPISSTNNLTTTAAPQMMQQPILHNAAAQRFLRSNPKRGHHRSYSDSAVLHFQNMIAQPGGVQGMQGMSLPQGTNPTDFPPQMQQFMTTSDYASAQQSMYMQQQQQMQFQMRQMRLAAANMNGGFGANMQQQPQHLANDQLGAHMMPGGQSVGIPMPQQPQQHSELGMFSSSAPTDNIDALMSDIMDPHHGGFDQDLDHNRRRSSSMFVSGSTRNAPFDHNPLDKSDLTAATDFFLDIPTPGATADDLLDFDLAKEPDVVEDKMSHHTLGADMNDDDPMIEDGKDFDLMDDGDVLSPDTTPLDTLLESPKHFRMRGHQRSQSFDPRMLSGHRFQPF